MVLQPMSCYSHIHPVGPRNQENVISKYVRDLYQQNVPHSADNCTSNKNKKERIAERKN